MDSYSFTLGSTATSPHIRQGRATQCKGLGGEYCFFPHLECTQVEATIDVQMLSVDLLASHAPAMLCPKSKEALSHPLSLLRRTHRVTKYNCHLARQPIVHQPCSVRGQKMHILWSQTKERQRLITVGTNQICYCRTSWGELFLWIQH